MSEANDTRLERIGNGSRKYYGVYRCSCPAKTVKEIYDYSVRRGLSTSCGCHRKAWTTEHNKGNKYGLRHGEHLSAEYDTWTGIIGRCENPDSTAYENWGGRGIKMCERWRRSFEAFLEDMGRKPTPEHSIDRIDNDGDYCPENCRWATRSEQLRNTRRNRNVTFGGKTQCVTAWAEELGVRSQALLHRLNRGWSVEDALTTPFQKRKTKVDRLRGT